MASIRSVAAPALPLAVALGAARVALGVLWIHEGYLKLQAGFGKADILLVADGASSNTRIPDYFTFVADTLLHPFAAPVGFVVPLLEVGLGVALITGVLTLPLAFGSLANLMVYWSSDLLVGAYPIMGILSGLLIAWPAVASYYSVSTLVRSRRSRPALSGAEA